MCVSTLKGDFMAEWTFVTNHAAVLSFLSQHPCITARELALEVGITERAVRKIIKDLEVEGYILKVRNGRRARYSVKPKRPLRHKTQRDKLVGDLLEVLGWDRKAHRKRTGDPCK
jgi:predicted ArsR family transcriptional regulator